MSIYNYSCERCGNEKQVIVEEGERLEDKICSCHSAKDYTEGFVILNSGATASSHQHEGHSHSCGCGGGCGCN